MRVFTVRKSNGVALARRSALSILTIPRVWIPLLAGYLGSALADRMTAPEPADRVQRLAWAVVVGLVLGTGYLACMWIRRHIGPRPARCTVCGEDVVGPGVRRGYRQELLCDRCAGILAAVASGDEPVAR